MSKVRNRLLITLFLLAAIILTPGRTVLAAPSLSSISAEDSQPQRILRIGRFSGEPDVGQTSPASMGRAPANSSARGLDLNDLVRLAVSVWKARYASMGL